MITKEIKFKIPTNLIEDYEILLDVIKSNKLIITEDIQEYITKKYIKGQIILTFDKENQDEINNIREAFNTLKNNKSLLVP